MADRFAALAGYSGASAYDSTLDQSITTNLRDDPPGLETTEPSINLDLPKNRPSSANITQRRKPAPSTTTINHEKPYHSNDRSDRGAPQTPFAPRSENVQHDPLGAAPPSTQRKPDPRRRYGVRIAVDEDALDEPEDSLEASGGEAELRRMQADLSEGGVDSMIGSPPANDSGQWGSRAMRRRSAAGVSMKSAQERINSLVKERDELKIEVDLLRGKVSLDDRVAELIVLKKEKLSSTQKMIAQQGFIKQQDKAIKALQKEQHAWKGRDPVEVDRLLADLEEQVRSANARADEERRERIRAEEEVEFLKGRGAHTSSTSRGRNEETLDEGGGEVARLKSEIEALQEDHANEKYELRRERDALQDELDAARDEIDELKDRSIHPGRSQRGDDNSLNRREIDELEQQITSYKAQNVQMEERQAELLAEIESHKDELYELRSSEEALQRELEVAKQSLEHASFAQEDDAIRYQEAERLAAEQFQEQIDRLRDSLAATQLQLDEKEAEAEKLETELSDQLARIADLEYDLRQLENTVESQKEQLEGVEAEADELDRQLVLSKEEVNAYKADLDELQKDLDIREADLAETNKEVQEMSDKLYDLEEQLDRRQEEYKRLDELYIQSQEDLRLANERHERLTAVLKDKLSNAGVELSEFQARLEACEDELERAREEAESYARQAEQLGLDKADLEDLAARLEEKAVEVVEDLKKEELAHDRTKSESDRKLDDVEDHFNRILEEKEEAIQSLERDLDDLERKLATSKDDIQNLQDALRAKENETERLGQSQANDKYSLELEIDRLKRDLARCESDLERARKDLERKDDLLRDREENLSKQYTENRELAGKLAAETQSRLGLDERFEAQQRNLAEVRKDLESQRTRAEELERQLNDGEKSSMQVEQQTRQALTERNTLLLTIYQFMGKILVGGEGQSTPRKKGEADVKPFTNFEVFHSSLIARLRKVSEIQMSFDQKAKEVEARFSDKFTALKRQQETRFRQIDRFEAAVKNAADKQNQWRQRVMAKQAEVDAIKSTNAELLQQISSLKTRTSLASPGDNAKLTALTTRANNAERRLQSAQAQATQAEERLMDAKLKYGEGEGKWAARIKELELRVKAAEERVKRERQGAKERVAELTDQMKRLEKELEGAQKRNKQLGEIQDAVESIE